MINDKLGNTLTPEERNIIENFDINDATAEDARKYADILKNLISKDALKPVVDSHNYYPDKMYVGGNGGTMTIYIDEDVMKPDDIHNAFKGNPDYKKDSIILTRVTTTDLSNNVRGTRISVFINECEPATLLILNKIILDINALSHPSTVEDPANDVHTIRIPGHANFKGDVINEIKSLDSYKSKYITIDSNDTDDIMIHVNVNNMTENELSTFASICLLFKVIDADSNLTQEEIAEIDLELKNLIDASKYCLTFNTEYIDELKKKFNGKIKADSDDDDDEDGIDDNDINRLVDLCKERDPSNMSDKDYERLVGVSIEITNKRGVNVDRIKNEIMSYFKQSMMNHSPSKEMFESCQRFANNKYGKGVAKLKPIIAPDVNANKALEEIADEDFENAIGIGMHIRKDFKESGEFNRHKKEISDILNMYKEKIMDAAPKDRKALFIELQKKIDECAGKSNVRCTPINNSMVNNSFDLFVEEFENYMMNKLNKLFNNDNNIIANALDWLINRNGGNDNE